MEETYHTQVLYTLYDIFDDIKVALSVLNQNKGLTINGPDYALLHRALEMSYQQGRKHTVDVFQDAFKQHDDPQYIYDTLVHYKAKLPEAAPLYIETTQAFDDVSTALATAYHDRGRHDVVDQLLALKRH